MPAAVLVVYDGKPDDPERFLRYYLDVHVPLVWKFPKIRAIQIERVVEGDIFMIARFLFDTPVDAKSALESPERAVARVDRDKFPAFKGMIRHQIVEVIEMATPHD
ncbi:MAG TPA: EthD family reductase [Pirellulaceae bacterium]